MSSTPNNLQQCKGITNEGTRCSRRQDGEYCHQHDMHVDIPDLPLESPRMNQRNQRNQSTMMLEDLSTKDELESLVIAMEHKLKIVKKKLYSLSDTKVQQRALRIYYHENKSNSDIIAVVRRNLQMTGMLRYKKTAKGVSKEIIPWQLVYEYTSELFDGLDASVKETYYARAKEV